MKAYRERKIKFPPSEFELLPVAEKISRCKKALTGCMDDGMWVLGYPEGSTEYIKIERQIKGYEKIRRAEKKQASQCA